MTSMIDKTIIIKQDRIGVVLVFFLALVFYALISIWLLQNNYLSDVDMSRWAKVVMMLSDEDPRLEYLGLLYPHFPLYLLMPFYFLPGMNSGLAAPILGALCAASLLSLWYKHLTEISYPLLLRWILVLLLACHPTFIWGVTTSFQNALSLLVFYFLCGASVRLIKIRDVRGVMLLGISLAVYFFIDERTLYLFFALLPLLPFIAPVRMMSQSLTSVYILTMAPMVIAVSAWVYISWIFEGDPLLFLFSTDSAFLGAKLAPEAFPWLTLTGGQWFMPLIFALGFTVICFPVVFWLFYHGRPHQKIRLGILVFIVHPAIAISLATLDWFLRHPIEMLFLISSAIMAGVLLMPHKRLKYSETLVLCLMLGYPGGVGLLLYHPTQDMQRWTNAIQGEYQTPIYSEDQSLGVWLAEDQNRYRTLIDDKVAYRAIVARGDGLGLVAPFSKRSKLELRQRDPTIEQIVVMNPYHPKANKDQITLRYPYLFKFGSEAYDLVFENDTWRVYRNKNVSAFSNHDVLNQASLHLERSMVEAVEQGAENQEVIKSDIARNVTARQKIFQQLLGSGANYKTNQRRKDVQRIGVSSL